MSCASEFTEPAYLYESKFDTRKIDNLIIYARQLALNENLEVREKNSSQMSKLTNGMKAFYFSYYRDNIGPILIITNVGVGTYINVDIYTDKNFDESEAESLANKIKYDLLTEFEIDLMNK